MSRKLRGALLTYTTVPHCTSESRGGICSCHSKEEGVTSIITSSRELWTRGASDHSLETQVGLIRALGLRKKKKDNNSNSNNQRCFIWLVLREKMKGEEKERCLGAAASPLFTLFSPIMQILTLEGWLVFPPPLFFLFSFPVLSDRIWFSASSQAAARWVSFFLYFFLS